MHASTIFSTLAVLALATAQCQYQKTNALSVCTAGVCTGNANICPVARAPKGDQQDVASIKVNQDICKTLGNGAKCEQTIACCPS